VVPSTKGEVPFFLGLAGYLRTWIPNFALLAQPLYEALTEPFLKLPQDLLQAPALSLPNLEDTFKLYVTK
jgi:hypothetical protein